MTRNVVLTGQDDSRPARLAALLEKRAPAYGRITYHLDVTELSPPEAARQIHELVNATEETA